jgi:hypothetical protein
MRVGVKLNFLNSRQQIFVQFFQVPEVDSSDYVYDMNIYHDALLCWSFRKALQAIHLPNALSYYELFQASDTSLHAGEWRKNLQNFNFYCSHYY